MPRHASGCRRDRMAIAHFRLRARARCGRPPRSWCSTPARSPPQPTCKPAKPSPQPPNRTPTPISLLPGAMRSGRPRIWPACPASPGSLGIRMGAKSRDSLGDLVRALARNRMRMATSSRSALSRPAFDRRRWLLFHAKRDRSMRAPKSLPGTYLRWIPSRWLPSLAAKAATRVPH